jgi:3-deoxy-manno-octulosonate cytidylyltransferase (CMP-KDO synthetase)
MKFILLIPAHLNSKRLKKKVLIKIDNLSLIEHVRRRAILSNIFEEIFVVTPNNEIKNEVENYGGKVLISKNKHLSGTSRVGEVLRNIKSSRIIILFADELLIDPLVLRNFAKIIAKDKNSDAWNLTSDNIKKKELSMKSIVKCIIGKKNYIVDFTRNIKKKSLYKKFKIHKSIGILCYKKNVLMKLIDFTSSKNEKAQKIEQFKLIENGFSLRSIDTKFNLPSVNTKKELDYCLQYLHSNYYQKKVLKRIHSIKLNEK